MATSKAKTKKTARKPTPKRPAKKQKSTDPLVRFRAWYGGLNRDAKRWYWVGVTAALVLVAFVVWQAFIFQEKREFEAARADLDQLQRELVANLGEPLKSEKDASCGYSSAKYSKGTLGCGVGFDLYYAYPDDTPTKTDLEKYESVFVRSGQITIKGDLAAYGATDDDYASSFDFKTKTSKLECVAEIKPTNGIYNSPYPGIGVNVGCGKAGAKAEHYPLREK